MAMNVFSTSPEGNRVVTTAQKLGDVAVIVQRLDDEGHRDVLVGSDEASALPFKQWETAAAGVRVESTK